MRAAARCSFLVALVVTWGCKAPSRTNANDGESEQSSARSTPDGESEQSSARSTAGDAGGGAVAPEGACRDDAGCPSAQFCEFTPGLCGKGKRPGTCRPRPQTCDKAYAPVCGCDGKAYANECSARTAGVDLAVMGGCKERIANFAPCGRRYCDVRTSYCEIFLSDVFELPTDYFCRPLPPSCVPADGAARTCDCFPAGTRCGAFCGPLPTTPGAPSGFHLTCQGTRPPVD